MTRKHKAARACLYLVVVVALLTVSHVAGGIHIGYAWLWG